MTVSVEEVHILIHQSALDAMKLRLNRLHRDRQRIVEEIETLEVEVRDKERSISAARDRWLIRGTV